MRAAAELFVHRDRLRTDMLFVVATLGIPVLLRSLPGIAADLDLLVLTLLFLHPLAVMRLALATGLVPARLRVGLRIAAGLSAGAMVTALVVGGTTYEPVPVTLFIAADAVASVVLLAAAWRRAGLSRLRVAALGSASSAVCAAVVVAVVAEHLGRTATMGGPIAGALLALAACGYWLGIAPPRPLRRHVRLQQLEQHLAGALDHGPGDPQAIVDHVRRTIVRITGAEHALVVLRGDRDDRFFSWTTAAIDEPAAAPADEAASVTLEGPWKEAWDSGRARLVERDQGDDELSMRARAGHDALLIVPFRSTTQRWGAIGVSYHGSPLFVDEDAHVLAIVGRDTALLLDHAQSTMRQSRLVEQLAIERRDLVRSNRELEAFAYTVSHDLKSPLIAQRWLVDQLQESLPHQIDDESMETIASLRRSIDRMTELTHDVLALARIGTEAQEIEAIDLAQVATDVADDLQKIAAETHAVVHVDADTLPVASGSASRYYQVLSNLVSNALAYGRKGDGCVKVRGRVIEVPVGAMWRIEVADNGPGVPLEETERIFDLGQRGTSAAGAEGNGMGLAIARKIARRYGGDLTVTRSELGGALFCLDLPLEGRILCSESAARAPLSDPLDPGAAKRIRDLDALFGR